MKPDRGGCYVARFHASEQRHRSSSILFPHAHARRPQRSMFRNPSNSSSSQSSVPPTSSSSNSELMASESDGSAFLPDFPGTTASLRIALRKLPKDVSSDLVYAGKNIRTVPNTCRLLYLVLDFNPSYESPSRSQPIYSGEFVANIPDSIGLIHQSASSTARQQSRGSVGVALQTDYADDLVAKSLEHQIVVQRPEDMFTPDPSSEKSSRKRKPESRVCPPVPLTATRDGMAHFNFSQLYNFLHPSRSRSRSGSRSRGGARSPTPPIPDEPLPQHPRSLSFSEAERPTSSVMSTPSSAKTARAGAKPTSRIPSRPLSSTTTATNTTITPRTPTQTKPKSRIFDHNTNGRRENPATSRPPSPKPSAARQKLHNFFGLPLRGRKPIVDSRASSPGPSGRGHQPNDLPPSPPRPSTATTHSQRMEYKPSQSTTSSHSQSWATTSNSHSRNASEDSVPKRSNSGSRLVRLFSGSYPIVLTRRIALINGCRSKLVSLECSSGKKPRYWFQCLPLNITSRCLGTIVI